MDPVLPLRPLAEPLPVAPLVADEPGEAPLLPRLVVVSWPVVPPGLRVELVVLPVVFGESLDTLGMDPVPFEPRLVMPEPADESPPLVPPRFRPEPTEPPVVPPLMPDVPLPLVPPVPLDPPDDCAWANPMVAASTAAATPAPILVIAFMPIS